MKVGVFGGTFDPIHRGHVAPVAEARRQLELDVIYYLPTASPPHRGKPPTASPFARYVMVELALLHEDGLEACTWEMTPGRNAYTVETLERFRRELPGADLHLLVGSDSLAQLPTWRRWRDILGLARLVILRRPGWRPEESMGPAEELRSAFEAGRVHLVDHAAHELSSTAIRTLLARGEQIPPGALAPLVIHYLRKYKLYDETTGPL